MPSSEHDEGLNVESMPALAVHPSPGSGEGAAPPLFRSPSGMSAQANYFAQNMFNLHFRKRMRLALQHHTWRMCKKLRGNMPVDMDTLEDELTHKNRDMTAGQAAARSVTPQQAEALGCKLLQACREGSYKEVGPRCRCTTGRSSGAQAPASVQGGKLQGGGSKVDAGVGVDVGEDVQQAEALVHKLLQVCKEGSYKEVGLRWMQV
eukprot:gene15166-21237_t